MRAVLRCVPRLIPYGDSITLTLLNDVYMFTIRLPRDCVAEFCHSLQRRDSPLFRTDPFPVEGHPQLKVCNSRAHRWISDRSITIEMSSSEASDLATAIMSLAHPDSAPEASA